MTDTIHIVYPEGFQATLNRASVGRGDVQDGDAPTPQMLFDEWNHGSGHESTDFLEAEVRSMTVGDFVGINGTYWQVLPSGFEMVKLKYVNRILKEVRGKLMLSTSHLIKKSMWAAAREYRDSIQFGKRPA